MTKCRRRARTSRMSSLTRRMTSMIGRRNLSKRGKTIGRTSIKIAIASHPKRKATPTMIAMIAGKALATTPTMIVRTLA